MTAFQKIKNIVIAIFMLIGSAIIFWVPEDGITLIVLILSISLIINGLRNIIYYFTMARHMVGGRSILYTGVIIFDLGVFSLSVSDNSDRFVILYMLIIHMFSGLVDILRALESKRMSAPSWRFKFSSGVVNIAIAIAAFVSGYMFKSLTLIAYIYSAGLIYSAISRIITAFRKTAIVYIQ
jgi:hypothetical protein